MVTLQTVRRPARPQPPRCEALEGRQLLNGGGAGGPWWSGPGPAGGFGMPPAEFHRLDHSGAALDHHGMGQAAAGLHHRLKPFNPPALSAQAKADLQTLQTDEKAFQAEIPASLTTQLKNDQATIESALSSLTPEQRKAAFAGQTSPPAPGSDPTAFLTNQLKAANVPQSQIDAISADFQSFKNTLSSLDPTLQAKIAADRAAVNADLGITGHATGPKGIMDLHPGFGL
jgi:hypothetical protein